MAAITFDDLPDAASAAVTFDDLPEASHGVRFDDLPDAATSRDQPALPAVDITTRMAELGRRKFMAGSDPLTPAEAEELSGYNATAARSKIAGSFLDQTPESLAALDVAGAARSGIDAQAASTIAPGYISLKPIWDALKIHDPGPLQQIDPAVGAQVSPHGQENDPVLHLPRPTADTIGAGIARGAATTAEGLTTPENLALLTGLGGAPRVLKIAAGVGFTTQMGLQAIEQAQNLYNSSGLSDSEKAEKITELVGLTALAFLSGKHTFGRPMEGGRGTAIPGETPAENAARTVSERQVGLTPEQADAAAEANRIRQAQSLANSNSPLTAAEVLKQGATNEEQSSPTPSDQAASDPAAQLRAGDAAEAQPARAEDGVGGSTVPAESGLQSEPSLTPSAETAAPLSAAEPVVRAAAGITGPAAEGNTRAAERPAAPLLESSEGARSPLGEGAKTPEPVEPHPDQAELALPKLDVKRSPFALGISPDNKALVWLGKNVKRLFTATGDLPKETFERWIERNGYVKAESRQTAYAARDLYTALKKEFNISTKEQLTKGFEKVPREFVQQMNRALVGEVDMNTLPEGVRAPLQAMRAHIDALSYKMLSEGVIPDSLQAKVADNLGVYMTRSYRVFDDPQWAESIPQDVRNRTNDFILSNLLKENPAATAKDARVVMEAMLQDWKDQGSGALVKSGGKIGSKDLTSFITRKDIPKVMREFMGEYHDPLINYARSVTKAANLIGSQRFLNQVRSEGMGKFLFEDGTQPAGHSALIAAEGSDVMAPLNGLRTTPEIADAFREFGKSDPIKNGFLRVLATMSGVAKSAKTVGSLMTQARNILGQTYFFAMNGHFDMTKAAPAVKAVLADLGLKDSTAGRDAYQRYLRLGIVDQSARASELRDIIRDSGLNDPGANLTEPGKIWARTAKKLTIDAAAKGYQVADDLGKIIGFENELVRQREIHPDWSETTLEATTAERIRNTYPTYSMVPKAVQNIRRLPIAPFASFAAETFRTAYHNLRYTLEDLQSSNPAQKKAGAQRLAGQLAVVASGYTLSAISRAMLAMNAQDEDDARRFMAPWDQDSQIMFTGKDDGQSTFVNLSYVNPYSYLTDPVVSVASGLRDKDALDDVMLRSFAKLLQPFTSEDIMAGAIVDIARNKTQSGGRVYNPGDAPGRQWQDKLAHLYNAVEPGTLTRVKSKIIPAIKGETDRTGRKPELSNEVMSELTGFKKQTLDYAQAVGYRARAFKKADDDAESIFREVAGRRGSVKPDELTDAYARATRSKFEAWQSFNRDVEAARRRGVSEGNIRTAVEARGVSSAEAGAVISGRFVPPRVSPALGKQMQAAKRSMPAEAVAEMRRAENLVLSGSFEPGR